MQAEPLAALIGLGGVTFTGVGSTVAYLLGRRGRTAAVTRDEADAAESLTRSVVDLGKRLDEVTRSLWDAWARLQMAEQRATAADQRAAAAELRAATYEQELVKLRAVVDRLTTELARYETAAAQALSSVVGETVRPSQFP